MDKVWAVLIVFAVIVIGAAGIAFELGVRKPIYEKAHNCKLSAIEYLLLKGGK